MTVELSAEEIVTNLLSSYQILKQEKENFHTTNQYTLGDFLKNAPKRTFDNNSPQKELEKYSFIKNKWII